MKKFSVKKILIGLGSVMVVGGVATSLYFVLNNDDKPSEKDNNLVTGVIGKVDITSNDDNLETVKSNVVRITNKLEDDKIVGSGFFIEDGYLVTNSHVVDIKGDISIEYIDGKTSKATLVSNDITSDVALLSVDDVNALAMNFGNTLNVKVTDDLYAVGYAINLEGESSITKGILSARRSMAGIEYLQTDAAINSGFSGGPLLNKSGEVVGMNSLANDNATIGMAISSESLQNIINKLMSEVKVTYLDSDRPANALSSVLKEVGYEIDDLYGEWIHFHKGEEKPVEKEEPVKKPYVPSNNCEATYIGVEGYDIGWNKRDESNKFKLDLINDENNVKVVVKTKDSKATYKVSGNTDLKYGYNTITVTIIAENGISKQQFWIITQKLSTTIDDVAKIETSAGPTKDYATGKKLFMFRWTFLDSDGFGAISEGGTNAVKTVNIDMYVCNVDTGCDGNTENMRLLKNYNSGPQNYYSEYSVPLSDVKAMLTDEDYVNGETANIYYKLSVVTKSQGTFSSTGTSSVSK